MKVKLKATDVPDDVACVVILEAQMAGRTPRPVGVDSILPVVSRRVRIAVFERLIRRGYAQWFEPLRSLTLTADGARLAASVEVEAEEVLDEGITPVQDSEA